MKRLTAPSSNIRVSGGLAHWARRLEFDPFRLRVTGTAGSGKTPLTRADFCATLDAGKRPLHVCFNRPLADHFKHIAPAGGRACTYHLLCDRRLRHGGETPDFSILGAFDRLHKRAAELPVSAAFLFDTLIVDEGQDIPEQWGSSWPELTLRSSTVRPCASSSSALRAAR